MIYKGFAPLYDSFSAFPHVSDSVEKQTKLKGDAKGQEYAKREALVTGGWATSRYKVSYSYYSYYTLTLRYTRATVT